MRISLSALLTIIPAFYALADGEEIRQQYKNGFRYLQAVNIAYESSVSTGLTNSSSKSQTNLEIESIANPAKTKSGEGTELAVRYVKAAMALERDGRRFQFPPPPDGDENADTKSLVGPLRSLAAVQDRTYKVILDEHGAVESVQEPEKAVAALSGIAPLTSGLFRDMFTKESMARFMDQAMIRTPKKVFPKNGEAWPLLQQIQMPGLGALVANGSYKLAGVEDYEGAQCSVIEISATITKELPARQMQDLQDNDRFDTLARQMRLKLDGSTMTGRVLFDPKIAFPRLITITHDLKINAKIPDGTSNAISMPIKQTTIVTLLEMTKMN